MKLSGELVSILGLAALIADSQVIFKKNVDYHVLHFMFKY